VAEYSAGLNLLKKKVREEVTALGIATDPDDVTFDWHPGRAVPDLVELKVAPRGAPVVLTAFSQAQVEDCHQRIERPDVLEHIRTIVVEYNKWLYTR